MKDSQTAIFYDHGVKELSVLLSRYSDQRVNSETELVGQFCDEEGMKSTQYGIYGIAYYLIINSRREFGDNLSTHYACKQLVQEAKKWISDTVNKTKNVRVKSFAAYLENKADKTLYNERENIYEAKNVVPKIAALYEACVCHQMKKEKELLLRYLKKGRNNDSGAFGYLVYHPDAKKNDSLIVTCIVARHCFMHNEFTREEMDQTINYITEKAKESKNIFHSLFALNTVQIVRPEVDYSGDIRNLIRRFLALTRKTYLFSNPVNLDFNDGYSERIRYFRLYSEIILLESLTFAHKTNLSFCNTRVAKYFFRRLTKVLQNKTVDISHHRFSLGYCYSISSLLAQLNRKDSRKNTLPDRFSYWFTRTRFSTTSHFEVYVLIMIPALILFITATLIKYGMNSIFLTICIALIGILVQYISYFIKRKID